MVLLRRCAAQSEAILSENTKLRDMKLSSDCLKGLETFDVNLARRQFANKP